MSQNLRFSEEDKKKLVHFLNQVFKHGNFTLQTQDIIDFYSNLLHIQKVILPKIEANIFEIKKIHETPPQEPTEKPVKAKKGS